MSMSKSFGSADMETLYCAAGMEVLSRTLVRPTNIDCLERAWKQWAQDTASLALAGAIAQYRGIGAERGLDLFVFSLLLRLFVEVFRAELRDCTDYYWWIHLEDMVTKNWTEIQSLVAKQLHDGVALDQPHLDWSRHTERLTSVLRRDYPKLMDDANDLIQHAADVLRGVRAGVYISANFEDGKVRFREAVSILPRGIHPGT